MYKSIWKGVYKNSGEDGDFLKNRLSDYDEHMLNNIEGANQFYKFTGKNLPMFPKSKVLDLGCGTGLELEEYFCLNSESYVVGLDLSNNMLKKLADKFPKNKIKLICGSYFDVNFGDEQYNAAVSVESLHNFTSESKLLLYEKLYDSLNLKGYFVLTDYFAKSDMFENFKKLKIEQGIKDNDFYHYDTPLTLEHEIDILKKSGFFDVKVLNSLGLTYTILAKK